MQPVDGSQRDGEDNGRPGRCRRIDAWLSAIEPPLTWGGGVGYASAWQRPVRRCIHPGTALLTAVDQERDGSVRELEEDFGVRLTEGFSEATTLRDIVALAVNARAEGGDTA